MLQGEVRCLERVDKDRENGVDDTLLRLRLRLENVLDDLGLLDEESSDDSVEQQ